MKIAILESEKLLRKIEKEIFEGMGVGCVVFGLSSQLLDYLDSHDVDFVITDLLHPDDHWPVSDVIRELLRFPEIKKVIVCSGFSKEESMQLVRGLGQHSRIKIFEKPTPLSKLYEFMNGIILEERKEHA